VDSYGVILLGNQRIRTETVFNSLDPVYEEKIYELDVHGDDYLRAQIWDAGYLLGDDLIGEVKILLKISNTKNIIESTTWFDLKKNNALTMERSSGKIQIYLKYIPLYRDENESNNQSIENEIFDKNDIGKRKNSISNPINFTISMHDSENNTNNQNPETIKIDNYQNNQTTDTNQNTININKDTNNQITTNHQSNQTTTNQNPISIESTINLQNNQTSQNPFSINSTLDQNNQTTDTNHQSNQTTDTNLNPINNKETTDLKSEKNEIINQNTLPGTDKEINEILNSWNRVDTKPQNDSTPQNDIWDSLFS